MENDTFAVMVAFLALALSVLGPVFSGIISLRRDAKEREARERGEETEQKDRLRRERVEYLKWVVEECIKHKSEYIQDGEVIPHEVRGLISASGVQDAGVDKGFFGAMDKLGDEIHRLQGGV